MRKGLWKNVQAGLKYVIAHERLITVLTYNSHSQLSTHSPKRRQELPGAWAMCALFSIQFWI